jgi:hypothetical protein
VLKEKKNFNSQGKSAVFLSKVPNCKDIKILAKDAPGPGYYEKQGDDKSILSDTKKNETNTIS